MRVYQSKLGFLTDEGQLLLTPEEAAQQERQRVEQIESQLDEEQQKAERMAQKLREMGIDPSTL